MVWFCVFDDSQASRASTRRRRPSRSFPLPHNFSKPYALGIAPDRSLWYSSESRDLIGRLDPDTGKVTEYPMPYTDNGMRDFFLDKDGHIWFGSPPNNKIGYFYISTKQRNAAVQLRTRLRATSTEPVRDESTSRAAWLPTVQAKP